ncbi:MAG TPA: hypothetical protein VF971_02445 [Candidatus Limnocylindrales bacterium]|jgi:hypothetical protein
MTDDLERAVAALPVAARARLQAFAAEFERVGATQYAIFATVPADPGAHEEAVDAAVASLGSDARRQSARAAAEEFVTWATVGYSGRLSLPDTLLLFQSLPDRPGDRVRFRRAVEDAILGIVAWDDLTDDELAELLGPFAEMAEAAIGPIEGRRTAG